MAYENGLFVPEVASPETMIIAEEDNSDDIIHAQAIRAQTRPDREPAWVTSVLGPRPGWHDYNRVRC